MVEKINIQSSKETEDWMNNKWRPMMGWMYMLVCIFDFVIFPVLWSIVQVIGGGEVKTQWSPITLQGAGLFHMAMGAILGIAAYGRTQEKLGDKAGGSVLVSASAVNTTSSNLNSYVPTKTYLRPMASAIELDPSDPPMRNTRND